MAFYIVHSPRVYFGIGLVGVQGKTEGILMIQMNQCAKMSMCERTAAAVIM